MNTGNNISGLNLLKYIHLIFCEAGSSVLNRIRHIIRQWIRYKSFSFKGTCEISSGYFRRPCTCVHAICNQHRISCLKSLCNLYISTIIGSCLYLRILIDSIYNTINIGSCCIFMHCILRYRQNLFHSAVYKCKHSKFALFDFIPGIINNKSRICHISLCNDFIVCRLLIWLIGNLIPLSLNKCIEIFTLCHIRFIDILTFQ